MSRFFSRRYENLIPYVPGEQPQDKKYVKLNTNESPFPPSEKAMQYAREAAGQLELYPDPGCGRLAEAFSAGYGVGRENVVFGNGSDENLNMAFMAFCDDQRPAIFADITYGFYPVFAEVNHIPYEEIPLREDLTLCPADYMDKKGTIFLANPNAPTGIALPRREIEKLAEADPDRLLVVDEAYVDFGAESCIPLTQQYENVLVIGTFSKSRSMAGARLGYTVGSAALIRDLQTIRYSLNPYNVNRMSMAAGIGALQDQETTMERCRVIMENREYTMKELRKLGFEMTPSMTNFVFARHPEMDGGELYRKLKNRGILVRHFDLSRICQYNRITIGTRENMDALLGAVREIMEEDNEKC